MRMIWDLSTADEKTVPLYVADFLNGRRRKHVIVHVLTLSGLASASSVQDSTFEAFREALRGLVDQWIESGRQSREWEGEEPLKRHLMWVSDAHPRPIRETLHQFWQRNPLHLTPDPRDGVLVARLDIRANATPSTDSIHIAKELGIAWFQRLIESVAPQRLSHCEECHRYFVRKRTPKTNTPIFRGVRCPDCASKGGVRRSLDSRKARKGEMVEFAAKVFDEWKGGNRNPDQNAWLAEQVSKRFKIRLKGVRLTRRWVTQNLKAIRTQVKRRNDAKG